MITQDQVLVEIVTAANLAGIEQARAGLLGFNAATLTLAAGLGITIAAGKAAVDVYEAHTQALARLKQATDVTAQSYPAAAAALQDFVLKNQAFIPDNNKAIDTFALLVRSTGDYRTALQALGVVMNLSAVSPTKDWDTATQAVNLGLQGQGRALKELGINIAALKSDVANATDANKELAKAQKEVEIATKAHDDAARRLAEMQAGIARPGHKATTEELMRLQDQQKRVTDEAGRLQAADVALTKAQNDVAVSATLQAQVLQQLQEKTAGGTKAVTEQQQAQNQLNATWQNFALTIGPSVVLAETKITEAATTALGILQSFATLYTNLDKIKPSGVFDAFNQITGSINQALRSLAIFSDLYNALSQAGGGGGRQRGFNPRGI